MHIRTKTGKSASASTSKIMEEKIRVKKDKNSRRQKHYFNSKEQKAHFHPYEQESPCIH